MATTRRVSSFNRRVSRFARRGSRVAVRTAAALSRSPRRRAAGPRTAAAADGADGASDATPPDARSRWGCRTSRGREGGPARARAVRARHARPGGDPGVRRAPPRINQAARYVADVANAAGVRAYDEKTGDGHLRGTRSSRRWLPRSGAPRTWTRTPPYRWRAVWNGRPQSWARRCPRRARSGSSMRWWKATSTPRSCGVGQLQRLVHERDRERRFKKLAPRARPRVPVVEARRRARVLRPRVVPTGEHRGVQRVALGGAAARPGGERRLRALRRRGGHRP